jgi:CheY-like chemotaxis protein
MHYPSHSAGPSKEACAEGRQSNGRVPVLIVEDDRISRRILSQLLRTSGYETQTAETAEEALRLLRDGRGERDAHTPGIALVDLNLPGMDGMELIDQLSDLVPSIVPVLVTATGEDSLYRVLSNRPVLYLRKPIDFGKLMGLLSELQACPSFANESRQGGKPLMQ